MASGNRLYLAQAGNGFMQTPLSDSIARSGWSWGCAAFDFDNDGFPDLYIANGLESNSSVRDYEGQFWLHDIFIDESTDDLTASQYFMAKHKRTRGRGWSYGGYEKNRLFLNENARSFEEIGHFAGLSLEQDSRNVVADDLDGDGRVDIVLTTREIWPEQKQTLKIFKNNLEDAGHWIGFRFQERERAESPVGTVVRINYGSSTAARVLVTGDSHRSQTANSIHFGLGKSDQVKSAEIRSPDGYTVRLLNPTVDQYHKVDGRKKSTNSGNQR